MWVVALENMLRIAFIALWNNFQGEKKRGNFITLSRNSQVEQNNLAMKK